MVTFADLPAEKKISRCKPCVKISPLSIQWPTEGVRLGCLSILLRSESYCMRAYLTLICVDPT
jgi:hypothetical protein